MGKFVFIEIIIASLAIFVALSILFKILDSPKAEINKKEIQKKSMIVAILTVLSVIFHKM